MTLINHVVGAVKLWWPNGAAESSGPFPTSSLPQSQPLYLLSFSITPPPPSASTTTQTLSISDSRTIGFRAFALVTDDDTNPLRLQNVSGSGNLTMRVKVNGLSVWARGSNVIPLDEFQGRADAAALMQVNHAARVPWLRLPNALAFQQMRSAAAAGMNMLLLWGGGIWQHTAFYEEADKLGLMIYHDLMCVPAQHKRKVARHFTHAHPHRYSAQGHMAHMLQPTANQGFEIAHQVRCLHCELCCAILSVLIRMLSMIECLNRFPACLAILQSSFGQAATRLGGRHCLQVLAWKRFVHMTAAVHFGLPPPRGNL